MGVDIEEYTQLIVNAVPWDQIEELLKTMSEREARPTEGLLEDLVNKLDFSKLLLPEFLLQAGKLIIKAFDKGGKRVMNVEGDNLTVPKVLNRMILANVMQDQHKYYKNYSEDIREKIRKSILESIEKGESIPKASKRIMSRVRHLSKARATLIARTEIIKASALGTKQAMIESDIKYVIYLATSGGDNGYDSRVSEICRANHTGGDPRKHFKFEKVYKIQEAPIPVVNSHPNCRCTLIAYLEDEL